MEVFTNLTATLVIMRLHTCATHCRRKWRLCVSFKYVG
jgi:hypothetical protein